jgi:hypothetical protein
MFSANQFSAKPIVQSSSALRIGVLTVSLLVPNLIGWYGMAWMVEARRPPSALPEPNPVLAPIYFLDPTEALVYFDPYWAGYGSLWFPIALAIPAALIAWTLLRRPSLAAAGTAGLAAGCLLAAPWLLAIALMAMD